MTAGRYVLAEPAFVAETEYRDLLSGHWFTTCSLFHCTLAITFGKAIEMFSWV